MARSAIAELWHEWWAGDIYIASWSAATSDLTPRQAAWTPEIARHSIWQLINHIIFWRQVTLDRIAGKPPRASSPAHDEQFASPMAATDAAWQETLGRLKTTHEQLQKALDADPDSGAKEHLGHDAYHLGQIMLLRAMQGLPPVV